MQSINHHSLNNLDNDGSPETRDIYKQSQFFDQETRDAMSTGIASPMQQSNQNTSASVTTTIAGPAIHPVRITSLPQADMLSTSSTPRGRDSRSLREPKSSKSMI